MLNALGEGTKEFENLQISLGLINKFGGPAADALKDLLDGVVNDERTGKFLAALGPGADDVRAALTKVGEGADPQILLDAFATAGGKLEEFANITGTSDIDAAKKRKAFIDGIRNSEPEIAAVLDFATKAKDAGAINLDNLREEQKRSNESTKLATSFDDKVKELRGAIQEIIINSGLLDEVMLAFGTFTDVLGSEDFKKAIKDMVEAFASKTKEFIGLFKEGGFKAVFVAAVGDIGGVLKDAFLSAITNPKVIFGIAGAFAALFALKAVSGAFVTGIGSLFGGGGGKGSAPGTAGSSKTSGGAKVGKNVGGFLGGLGEGVLKGAAAGLRAFAHPMVPVGAAAIGAAIVAIGAGIAGASWILGKALPTFVDGLKSFEDLDGDALGSAATGMVKLSGAMAAFGAGTAVAGLGSLVGGITQGIVSLFGGDDPLQKVIKFSEAKIDGKKVEANAKALVAFSTAMSAAGSAESATGLGGLVGGIAGGIGSMFGGTTDPLIDLKTFGDTKVNGAQVKSNAEAMVAYADAMTAVAPGATAGLGELVGNIAGGIGKLFGLEKSDPTKDLETFGNLNINSGQVKTNAEAMVAFGEAMSALPPTMPGDGVFTSFGKAIAGFFGAETPFEQLQNFGNLQFDSAKVKTNSEALVAFGTALASMPTDELGTLKLDKSFVTNLKNLSMVDGQGLNTVQTSLANIVNTPNLKTTLADLNDLGKNYKNVEDLAEAMEDLADAMKEVNQQSKNTSRGRNAGRGNNNETSSASASIIAGSGTGSGNDQLNSIMSRIEILLSEMRDTDRKILTATQNNAGNVAIALGN